MSRWGRSDGMVISSTKLVSRDEQEMVNARKRFYKKAKKTEKDFLKTGDWIGKKGIPIFVVLFCLIYWGYGLGHYFISNP